MAKKKEVQDIVQQANDIEVSNIPEKSIVNIILFASSRLVNEDTEKEVSGNVANILINKGFAKLKN
jgi:hypothetical protein